MVILIIRKFCFQPRSPGGLFLRNSGYLFYSKFMRCAPPSVPNIQSQHWYLHLSRDTHENTRASTHSSSVPRKMSNPPPDQQIAPRGTRNQHLGQLRAGETGTSLLPPRGQATADSGRNRSTAGGYDVIVASLWARWAPVARGASIAPPGLCKRTAEHALDGSTRCDFPRTLPAFLVCGC